MVDTDADGDLDLAMGQNFFGPQSETGRYDGGLSQLLTNDGQGKFEPVTPTESGVAIREAVADLQVADINQDGKPDLLFATNDGPVRVFLGKQQN